MIKMGMIRNYNLGKNVNFTIFLKKFTFFFLVVSYLTFNDVSQFCKSLENIYKQGRTWNIKFNRLLARHEQLRELERTRLREKLSDRRPYTEKRNVSDNIKTYSHVKRNESNNIDVYMKNYKHRYGKKKGLSKLDCYYENKVFRKFCDISDIGKKMKYDEERSKSFYIKKYGIGLILFALIPALGLIFPMLFGISGSKIPSILGPCPDDTHFTRDENKHQYGNYAQCNYKWLYDHEDLIIKVSYFAEIFSYIMIITVISVIFYILIKLIKYERLKSGKGKMSVKEYYRFCKDIF
ncbi:Plasmodium exported protein, unknown function [Plasmodium vivax]|uniref:Variable surface protein n=1 Tax=Plasmodium vivax TaxID=5855 RepID=A0A1G4E9I0_PLAVI|nr:Plasmodium exported protein, unknown function [Plasmodium vivax]VUZ95043.1 Plasmodium exported protein, unknown function [Plasmodium vivax]